MLTLRSPETEHPKTGTGALPLDQGRDPTSNIREPVPVSGRPFSDFAVSLLTLQEWQRAVEASPDSTPFHHRNWLELLGQQYGFRPRIPALTHEGRAVAAIPFLETRGLLGARKLISLPLSDCVPLLPAPADAMERLCHLIRADDKSRHYEAIVVRSNAPLGRAACVNHHVRHTLRTDRPWNEVYAGFDKAILRNLRQAESHGLSFAWRTDPDAIEVYYGLHVMTRKKLGVPVQPKGYFRRLHQWMIRPGLASVGVVSRGEQPVAAAVLLTYKRTMVYKYSASDPRALELRPNDVLVLNVIRRAVDEKLACFDFGVSHKDQEGLRRFKRKWGATESDVYHAYLAGRPRDVVDHSLPFKALSFVIRHSPSAVCRLLGEALYRFSQ